MKYILLALLFCGCSTARMVVERPNGGRVVVYGAHSIAAETGKEKAREIMANKCGGKFDVLETGSQVSSLNQIDENQYYEFKCGGK